MRILFGLMMMVLFSGVVVKDGPQNAWAAEFVNTVEVGDVHWRRDYKKVMAESQNIGKPVLILFQEVPG